MSSLLVPRYQHANPSPWASDGVLIRMKAASICASDRRCLAGQKPNGLHLRPTILGHEGGGVVIDPGCSRFQVGDKVVVLPHLPCGVCDCCKVGDSNLCKRLQHVGFDLDGVLALNSYFDERLLYPVGAAFPNDALPLVEPLACALRAVGRAARFLGALPAGTRVAIFGSGPMGALLALAVRRDYPRLAVTLVDTHPTRCQVSAQLGLADQVVDRFPDGQAGVAFDATSTAHSAQAALTATISGGAVILFAGKDQAALNIPNSERLRNLEDVHRSESIVPPSETPEDRWLVGSSGYTYNDVRRAERELVARIGYWSQVQTVLIEGLQSPEAIFLRPQLRIARYSHPAVEVFLASGGVDDVAHGEDVASALKVLIRMEDD